MSILPESAWTRRWDWTVGINWELRWASSLVNSGGSLITVETSVLEIWHAIAACAEFAFLLVAPS